MDHFRTPKFESTIAGSGDLQIDNAQVGSFALSIAGSGDVVIAGTADEARFGVAGSGDINASGFTARKVQRQHQRLGRRARQRDRGDRARRSRVRATSPTGPPARRLRATSRAPARSNRRTENGAKIGWLMQ